MPLDADRQRLLKEINKVFGVTLHWSENVTTAVTDYRPDVTVHWFIWEGEYVTADFGRALRAFLEQRGWQYSRQLVVEQPTELIYIGRLFPVAIDFGYHATRMASLPGIKRHGLLPGDADRQTTGRERRRDCEGNLYVCEHLGAPGDRMGRGSKTAHWWRGALAAKTGSDIEDWGILKIQLNHVAGSRVYKDIWSESGIVVSSFASIPWEMISIAYPDASV
jgi:hypothetical protein